MSVPAIRNPDRELVSKIAMDIGKSAISHLRVMYPDVFAVMNSGCRLSLRNHIHNEIMAAISTVDVNEIETRLTERAKQRRKDHALWAKIRDERVDAPCDVEA